MKNLILFACLAFACAPSLGSAAAPSDDTKASAIQHQILQIEAQRRLAALAGNVAVLDSFAGADAVEVTGGGNFRTKAENSADLKAGRLKFSRYDASEETVRVFNCFAIYNAKINVAGAILGQQFSGVLRSGRVYALRDGRWLSVYSQITPITAK
jgi:hypothetical protein